MRSRLRIRLAIGAVGALVFTAGMLAACAPAHGTVRIEGTGEGTTLVFRAAAGKANDVVVTRSGGDVLLSDAGDTVTPGSGCTVVDADTARCTGAVRVVMDLGDWDDVASNDTDLPSNFPIASGLRGLVGGPGNDTLEGGSSADSLSGDEGNDTLMGRGGNDGLFEGTSASAVDVLDVDTFDGGDDNDAVTYFFGRQNVSLSLNATDDDGRPTEGDAISDTVENLGGGDGADTLIGNDLQNRLGGNRGNDVLIGNGAGDDFRGGLDDDSLLEGLGAASVDALDGDSYRGEEGVDTVSYAPGTAPVQVDLDDAPDDGRFGEDDNVHADVENITGGGGDDILTGDGDANRLTGNGGPDTIDGAAGPDVLRGNLGFDLLNGGTETDDCDVGGVGANGGSEFNCEV